MSEYEQEVLKYIKEDEVVKFHQKVVQTKSVSNHEKELAYFLGEEMEKWGLKVTYQKVSDDSYNVIGILKGKGGGKRLLYNGHIDTVPPMDLPDPFSGKIIDGTPYGVPEKVIWGRGSADQKGGVSAMMMALKAVVESGFEPRGDIIITGTADEESEHKGIAKLVESKIVSADMGISTEPTFLKIGLGNRGTSPFKITTHGKSAHGGHPWKGVNAVYHMAEIVLALKDMPMKEFTIEGVGTVKGSINVGVIKGGDRYNRVPDWCEIYIDRRTVPGETQKGAMEEIKQLLEKIKKEKIPDLKAEIEVSRHDWVTPGLKAKERGLLPYAIKPDEPIVLAMKDAYKRITGEEPKLYIEYAYTDADWFYNDLGIPMVVFGPGRMELGHSSVEFLEISQLMKATQILAVTNVLVTK